MSVDVRSVLVGAEPPKQKQDQSAREPGSHVAFQGGRGWEDGVGMVELGGEGKIGPMRAWP